MIAREKIAQRVAREVCDGDVVNLGIGLPSLVSDYIPEDIHAVMQSENGMLGMGAPATPENIDNNIVNAGGVPVLATEYASFFDSAMSFAIIRGGHVDITVLGALQVDVSGSLASHIIPGKMVPGMGGAMDLVTGAKKVIVAMTHTAKDGSAKILPNLTLPATALNAVDLIITEMAVIQVMPQGLLLTELAEGISMEQVIKATEAKLEFASQISRF